MPASPIAVHVEIGEAVRLGPGKVRLLELITEHGSINAAGRPMDIAYRRAWLLVDALNEAFCEPVVVRNRVAFPTSAPLLCRSVAS